MQKIEIRRESHEKGASEKATTTRELGHLGDGEGVGIHVERGGGGREICIIIVSESTRWDACGEIRCK